MPQNPLRVNIKPLCVFAPKSACKIFVILYDNTRSPETDCGVENILRVSPFRRSLGNKRTCATNNHSCLVQFFGSATLVSKVVLF